MLIYKLLNIVINTSINISIKAIKYFDYITQIRILNHNDYIDKLRSVYIKSRKKAIDKHGNTMLDVAKLRTKIEIKTKGTK